MLGRMLVRGTRLFSIGLHIGRVLAEGLLGKGIKHRTQPAFIGNTILLRLMVHIHMIPVGDHVPDVRLIDTRNSNTVPQPAE